MSDDDYDREMDAWNDANDKLQQLREDSKDVIECLTMLIKDIEHLLLRQCRNNLTKALRRPSNELRHLSDGRNQ